MRPLVVLLFALALPAAGATAARAPTVTIKTAHSATLGKRILTTSGGRTLYSLSAETRGRFVCTGSCLTTWPPLILRRGARAVGVRHLGSVRRPDGRRQATYKGRPLYRFFSDAAKGDVGGEGFRDVGTWHAAVAPGG